MENEKNIPPEDSWFDSLMSPEGSAEEIKADELAVSGSGLAQIGDMELEKILKEASSEEWDPAAAEALLEAGTFDPDLNSVAIPENLTGLSDPELAGVLDVIAEESSAKDAPAPENVIEEHLAEDPPAQEPTAENTDAEQPESDAPAADNTIEDAPKKNPTVRKVRPKRKKGYGLFGLPHLASTAIWLVLAITIGVSLGRLLWVCASDILAFGREDQVISITITESDDLDDIVDKLYNAGLIKYKDLFMAYADLAKLEEKDKIKPGTYELNTLYDYHALVDAMSASDSRKEVEITIPEGYTCAQIFALLEEKGICTVAELERYAETSKFSSYDFLVDMERGTKYCLEGFLFPDTYKFYLDDTPQHIFHKMLSRFDEKFTDEMEAKLEELNTLLAQLLRQNGQSQEYIDQNKITIYKLVTIASMIEKETAHSGESQTIAAVIYNRLTNPSEYPLLNIDATIVYALGGKTNLTPEDKYVDHPYNTYVKTGLPPGAISNPGLFSLAAALSPAEDRMTSWSNKVYYYALDPSIGEHRFFRTYEEHLDFLAGLG